jgi:hypothetical protein
MIKRLLFLNLLLVLIIFPVYAGNDADTSGTEQLDSADMLSAFSARIKDKSIHLNWKITNPENLSYFEIQRKDSKSKNFTAITKNKAVKSDSYYEEYKDENNLTVYKYNFEDEPKFDGVYYYRLKAFDSKGGIIFESDEIKIGISGIKDFILEQNHPNPFNPSTSIKYELFSETHVTLKVYDLIGREIATLVNESQGKGEHSVVFDASKFSNLTSGIYFYKLSTENYSDVKKMILTK